MLDDEGDRYGLVLHGCYDRPSDHATDHALVWIQYYVSRALVELMSEA